MRLRARSCVGVRIHARTSTRRRLNRWHLVGPPIARNDRAPHPHPRRVCREPTSRLHTRASRPPADVRRRCGPAHHARGTVCARPKACGRRSTPGETGPAGLQGRKRAESLGIRIAGSAKTAWPGAEYCPSSDRINQAPMCAGVAHPTGLHLSSLPHATI